MMRSVDLEIFSSSEKSTNKNQKYIMLSHGSPPLLSLQLFQAAEPLPGCLKWLRQRPVQVANHHGAYLRSSRGEELRGDGFAVVVGCWFVA